jgi:uncharacterized protein YecE (DUF72 family)
MDGALTGATIRIGTAGWAIPSRTRSAFPEIGTGLERYASRFNAVEVNSTFHRSHKPSTYARWAAAVPDDFRFAVKMPRTITHDRRLLGVAGLVDAFWDELDPLRSKLGPLLIQLPPSLAFDANAVRTVLGLVRKQTDGPIVCEPRHLSWFDADADRLLSDHGVARVAADPARVREAAVPGGSQGLVYRRLHGSPRMYYSEYGAAYVEDLAGRIVADGAAETWCMFDNTASGAAMADALALREQLASSKGSRTGA